DPGGRFAARQPVAGGRWRGDRIRAGGRLAGHADDAARFEMAGTRARSDVATAYRTDPVPWACMDRNALRAGRDYRRISRRHDRLRNAPARATGRSDAAAARP